jgi:hypothetical protein
VGQLWAEGADTTGAHWAGARGGGRERPADGRPATGNAIGGCLLWCFSPSRVHGLRVRSECASDESGSMPCG